MNPESPGWPAARKVCGLEHAALLGDRRAPQTDGGGPESLGRTLRAHIAWPTLSAPEQDSGGFCGNHSPHPWKWVTLPVTMEDG